MHLINCEVNHILTWLANCAVFEGNGVTTFSITDTKRYVLVITLSTENNTKVLYCLLHQDSNAELTAININQM